MSQPARPPFQPFATADDPARGRSHTRVLDDVAALKALAHPVRLELLDALLKGPLTATEAGQAIDESATTCSFHLRQLAKYGFVEEAERGPGRRRSWRRTQRNWRIPSQPEDPNFGEASSQVHAVMIERYFDQIRHALVTEDEPSEWREALIGSQSVFIATAAELRQFEFAYNRLIAHFVSKWGARADDETLRPVGARLVEILAFGIPIDRSVAVKKP